MNLNITKYNYKISKNQREKKHGHKAFVVWFTGLSGSGKSTLANLLEIELHNLGMSTYILDGDNIRQGINKDLSFSSQDRSENIRRIAEIGNLMIDAGIITLSAFVLPFQKDREMVRKTVGKNNFIEVFINTSLSECEKRDVKGLYKKARAGEISNMTGISSPYEPPTNPDLEIITDKESVEESLLKLLKFIKNKINHE